MYKNENTSVAFCSFFSAVEAKSGLVLIPKHTSSSLKFLKDVCYLNGKTKIFNESNYFQTPDSNSQELGDKTEHDQTEAL